MDNNNKDLISKDIEKLLEQWQDADRKNRSVIVIACEKSGDGHNMENYIAGNGGILIESILNTIRDKNAKNSLAILMRKAIMLDYIGKTCDDLERLTKVVKDMQSNGKEDEL